MLVAAILLAEASFWILLAAGLLLRYVAKRPRVGLVFLAAAPLVDLVVLVLAVLDLRQGGHAHLAHVLAAIYIGVSVGYGHRLISAADAWVAHRFADGPRPAPKPKSGPAHAAAQRAGWLRHLRAWAAGAGLMLLAHVVIGDPARTELFVSTALTWTAVLALDGAISLSYTFAPKRPARLSREPAQSGARLPR